MSYKIRVNNLKSSPLKFAEAPWYFSILYLHEIRFNFFTPPNFFDNLIHIAIFLYKPVLSEQQGSNKIKYIKILNVSKHMCEKISPRQLLCMIWK